MEIKKEHPHNPHDHDPGKYRGYRIMLPPKPIKGDKQLHELKETQKTNKIKYRELLKKNPQYRCAFVESGIDGSGKRCWSPIEYPNVRYCRTHRLKAEFHLRRIVKREINKNKIGKEIQLLKWSEKFRKIKGEKFSLSKFFFLNEVYDILENAEKSVIMKGVQLGCSELAINRAIHQGFYKKMRIIYVLPDKSECEVFSTTRFDPAINPLELNNKINNRYIKQVGEGFILLRGTWEEKSSAMVDSDFNIYDELDLCDQKVVGQYIERIEASEYGWEMSLSKPTIENYGIHERYMESNQRHWMQRCGCGKWNTICCGYPELWDEDKKIWRCPKCSKEITNYSRTEWVPKFPENTIEGFHVSSPCKLNGEKFWNSMNNKNLWRGNKEKYLFNALLGLPYTEGDNNITEELLRGCEDSRVHKQIYGENYYMGIDMGAGCHIIILRRLSFVDAWGVVYWKTGGVNEAEKLIEEAIDQFRIKTTVMDLQPDILFARGMQNKYAYGKIWLNYYEDLIKKEPLIFDNADGLVHTQRNISIDKIFKMLKNKEMLFPMDNTFEEVRNHLKALVKVEKEDTRGRKQYWWGHNGPDHYAHALNYAIIATEYTGGFEGINVINLEEAHREYEKMREEKRSAACLK